MGLQNPKNNFSVRKLLITTGDIPKDSSQKKYMPSEGKEKISA